MKTFYFKIEGRITADDEGDTMDNLYNLLEGKTDISQIIELEEVDEK